MQPITLFWHRRDLRLHDNAGLYHALKSGGPVLPLFIFDTHILDDLEEKKDARVEFIHDHLMEMQEQLRELGSSLLVRHGKPEEVFPRLLEEFEVKAVYTNRDYEPYARERDKMVADLLQERDIPFHAFKDHVIFEEKEVLTGEEKPYTVFSPYKRKWFARLKEDRTTMVNADGEEVEVSAYLRRYPTEEHFDAFWKRESFDLPSLEDIGFARAGIPFPPREVPRKRIKNYGKTRNFPGIEGGTSRLGVHFRFGTISIREKARRAQGLSDAYLNELIWRDFYAQILANYPHVVNEPFRAKYSFIPWRDDEEQFQAWCEGRTGYPIVDAGMRQLNQTGYMHNRVRMITASFLTKHLLIDWRKGEAYFAKKLLDYELASNNGGWQWAAGSGTDAAPYFRVFNPYSQREKFDKDYSYVKEWVPEFDTDDYPDPIVEHKFARERCLETYKEALAKADEAGVS